MARFCDSAGIYFLIDRGEIVYIGATTRWPGRLSGHINKNFNAVRFIPCRQSKLHKYELRWIFKFKPKLNKIGKSVTAYMAIHNFV